MRIRSVLKITNGEERPPTQTEIAARLRLLADEMDEMSAILDCYGGSAEWSMHSREIAGAGNIARQWADSLEPMCKCGIPWEPDMDQFGCWSCGAEKPTGEASERAPGSTS